MSLLKYPFKTEKPLFLQPAINLKCQNLYKCCLGARKEPGISPRVVSPQKLAPCGAEVPLQVAAQLGDAVYKSLMR